MIQPRVVFVDLDGTLVLENSFHAFCLQLWRNSPAIGRARFLAALGFRTLQPRRGRVKMKQRLMRACEQLPAYAHQAVVDGTISAIARSLSEPVTQLIASERRSGSKVVLATAAPAAYAAPLANCLGLDGCIATRSSTEPFQETLGQLKAARCSEWAESHGIRQISVVTDHADDLPLLEIANDAVICGSKPTFEEIASRVGKTRVLSHIDTESAEAGGGAWIWMDGDFVGPLDRFEVATILSKHRYALVFTSSGWVKCNPDSLQRCTERRTTPPVPGLRLRIVTTTRRRIVRDALGVFH